jgi:O-antigen ligase
MNKMPRFFAKINLNESFWLTLLIASPILLLPVGRSSELPIAIMAIWGLIKLIKSKSELFSQTSIRHFSLLFLLIWLPIMLSFPDSFSTEQTLRVGASYLRFYLAGIFIIDAFNRYSIAQNVMKTVSWFLLFLLADALVQFILGFDILGYPYDGERVNGIFGDDLKLGLTISLLSSFLLIQTQKSHWMVKGIVWGILVLIILLSGSRASWVMFAVSFAGLFFFQVYHNRHLALRYGLVILIALPIGVLATYQSSDYVKQRIEQTLLLFKGDVESADIALSVRLPLWRSALAMFQDEPINGIGVRAYRDVYLNYAPDNDFFRVNKVVPTHIHQMILEVGTETGSIGLIGLLAFYFVLMKRLFKGGFTTHISAVFSIGVLAATFPINTHLALYSSFWGMLFWWLIAQHCATLRYEKVERPE